MKPAALTIEALRRSELPAELDFESTEELADLERPFGQDRAVEALRLAIALRRGGGHVFAMGRPGSGRHALVLETLRRAALDEETPSDWCYLHDFADPRRPRAIELPAGRAVVLRRDLEALVAELRAALPAAFRSVEYRARSQLLEKEVQAAREQGLEEVRRRATERGCVLLHSPVGWAFAPIKEGQVIGPDEFRELSDDEKERYRRDIVELQGILAETLQRLPELERGHREQLAALRRETATRAAQHLVDALRRRWADLPEVLAHLDAVQRDVVENVGELVGSMDGDDDENPLRKLLAESSATDRWGANVLVDHAENGGAPVVYEDLPTLPNLVGRIEHRAQFGMLSTDFTLVRGGALHRANGGYLVLDARRLLEQPFAWDALKRALRSGEVRIEPPERLLGFASTVTLEPRPVPLRTTVVLVGDRVLYHLLGALDPEFLPLFKVEADFEDDVARTPEVDRDFARLVATFARREGLPPFDAAAVARVLREATRLSGDPRRIGGDLQRVQDLVREAAQHAAAAARPRVAIDDVRAAVAAQARRGGRVEDLVQEEIRRGTLVVETAGARVGQVNALSVIALGRRAFGRPSRITARVRLGRGEVVDIEREVALGGPLHSKGVLILAGYLGARYCRAQPLALAATVVFEQSYAGVEGDSASLAELYALLSAIAEVPIRQTLAVTGSVDQLGRVQAVGGLNEKIEGFFDVCRARGLTGAQGVLLPEANVQHLVLREDVLAAVVEGGFGIYPVERVEDGIELLTGVPPGAPDAEGRFPPSSFDAQVAARLEGFAATARAFGAAAGGGNGAGDHRLR